MATKYILAKYDGVEGEALLPESAFPYMPGWVPVDPDVKVPSLVDGTIPQVLDEVGDDPAKAAAALEAERAGKKRTTLVDALSDVIPPK